MPNGPRSSGSPRQRRNSSGCAGAATTAYDVVFNREVLGEAGRYFRNAQDVAELVDESERDAEVTSLRGKQALERAALYDWDDVADRYEALCTRLADAKAAGR